MAITAVCFDVGGVLVQMAESFDEACRVSGIDVRTTDFHVYLNRAVGIRDAYRCGKITTDEFLHRLSFIFERLYSPDELRMIIFDSWIYDECPGVGSIVADLMARGVTTAALSNTNSVHWKKLMDFEVMKSIAFPFGSHELGFMKPDMAVYKIVENYLERSAENILFFDDNLENAEVAQQCGWHGVHIEANCAASEQILRALRELRVLV